MVAFETSQVLLVSAQVVFSWGFSVSSSFRLLRVNISLEGIYNSEDKNPYTMYTVVTMPVFQTCD